MPRPRNSALAQAREAFDSGDFQRARVLAQEAVRASDTTSERAAESARPRSEGSSRAEARRILALALLYDDRGDEAERLADEAIRIARAATTCRASSTRPARASSPSAAATRAPAPRSSPTTRCSCRASVTTSARARPSTSSSRCRSTPCRAPARYVYSTMPQWPIARPAATTSRCASSIARPSSRRRSGPCPASGTSRRRGSSRSWISAPTRTPARSSRASMTTRSSPAGSARR